MLKNRVNGCHVNHAFFHSAIEFIFEDNIFGHSKKCYVDFDRTFLFSYFRSKLCRFLTYMIAPRFKKRTKLPCVFLSMQYSIISPALALILLYKWKLLSSNKNICAELLSRVATMCPSTTSVHQRRPQRLFNRLSIVDIYR